MRSSTLLASLLLPAAYAQLNTLAKSAVSGWTRRAWNTMDPRQITESLQILPTWRSSRTRQNLDRLRPEIHKSGIQLSQHKGHLHTRREMLWWLWGPRMGRCCDATPWSGTISCHHGVFQISAQVLNGYWLCIQSVAPKVGQKSLNFLNIISS
jgi:hypothetical protein